MSVGGTTLRTSLAMPLGETIQVLLSIRGGKVSRLAFVPLWSKDGLVGGRWQRPLAATYLKLLE